MTQDNEPPQRCAWSSGQSAIASRDGSMQTRGREMATPGTAVDAIDRQSTKDLAGPDHRFADTRSPAWLREFQTAVVTNPHIMIYGNVRDSYLIPYPNGSWRFLGIRDAVSWALNRLGFPVMICVDIVDGLSCVPDQPDAVTAATQLLPSDVKLGSACTLSRSAHC